MSKTGSLRKLQPLRGDDEMRFANNSEVSEVDLRDGSGEEESWFLRQASLMAQPSDTPQRLGIRMMESESKRRSYANVQI